VKRPRVLLGVELVLAALFLLRAHDCGFVGEHAASGLTFLFGQYGTTLVAVGLAAAGVAVGVPRKAWTMVAGRISAAPRLLRRVRPEKSGSIAARKTTSNSDSDSAATDMLIQKLGGPKSVQAFLDRRAVRNVRVDRDEKHLQTEILGLMWKPEYVDADALTRAANALPEDVRDAAFKRYQTDVRDTATPLGMATLLQSLASNTLLSPASSKRLIDVMKQTVTYPGRLKAGTAPGWTIAHKTGTSGTWKGVTVAVNDVGILGAPDGGTIAIAVFLGDSRASEEARDALIAKLAAAAIDHYR